MAPEQLADLAKPPCGATHPTNRTVVPCVREQGHHGDHLSTTGCAGSEMSWSDGCYTNAPGRKPRIGDVARVENDGTHYVFVGDGWVVGRPDFLVGVSNKRSDAQRFDWDASDLLHLVDPSELGGAS